MAGAEHPTTSNHHEVASSPLAAAITVSDTLDRLWEEYLRALDEYEAAQRELQQHMSRGFFSLAQANFNCSDRRRYGQDYYDGRMKASLACAVDLFSPNYGRLELAQINLKNKDSLTKEQPGPAAGDEETQPIQQASPPETPKPQEDPAVADSTCAISGESEHRSRDPVRWFGILVPRELRAAQASFTFAVNEPVVRAVNSVREMCYIESEIRKARKALKKAEKAIEVF